MGVVQAFRLGLGKTNQSKRMIVFAWLVNVALAMIVVVPLLTRLDASIGPTAIEERLLNEMDANWFQTFKLNNKDDGVVRMLDYTIFGPAPFLVHYDSYLSGTVIKSIGRFLVDLVFRLKIGLEHLGPLSLLAFLYILASTYLTSGFIGMYAKDYRFSFQEFLIEGAKYFGRFFRLSLLSLIVYLLLFGMLLDWWSSAIPVLTSNEHSEMVPFVHYMIKNGVTILLLGFLTLCFDYAKIRIVTEERMSALFALWAGVRLVFTNFTSTTGLYLLVSVISVILVLLFAFLQGMFSATGYWSILLLFILHQITITARLWIKALFYASQTQLARRLLEARAVPLASSLR